MQSALTPPVLSHDDLDRLAREAHAEAVGATRMPVWAKLVFLGMFLFSGAAIAAHLFLTAPL